MGNNAWIVDNLNNAPNTWNGKLAEIWQLLTQSPQTFKGGGVWAVWSYVGELVFNLLILVGAIKGCDHIVKEIMGL